MKPIMDNMQKYENYREQMGRLKKAMGAQFYLEAIFIEYAILEDRLTSALQHKGAFNPERHNTLNKKLNKLKDMQREKRGLTAKYFSPDLFEQLVDWKDGRNQLIHDLLNQSLHTEDLKEIAERGQALLKLVSNKVKSYNHELDRAREKKEGA